MKAALVNSQNIVDNVIVWVDGDTWSGDKKVVVVDDSVVVAIGFIYNGGTSFAEPQPTPPTPEEQAEMVRMQRQSAYIAEADPLFFKAQRGEVEQQVWLDKVAEIKARYPKEAA